MRLLMNINRNNLFLIISVFTVLISSCSDRDFKLGETGYKYKIVRQGYGPAFKDNHYIFMNMDYYYENDSLLFSSAENDVPVTMQYFDTLWDRKGQLYQGIKKLNVGDSAIFKVNCSNLYEVSFRGNIPYGLNPFGEITVHIGVTNMKTANEFRMWQAKLYTTKRKEYNKKQEEQLYEDIALIDMYLEEFGLIAMELESGIRYIIKEEGNGIKPEEGDKVQVHYTGYLLDGTKFDSSYDRGKPYEFGFGTRNVIKGWNHSVGEMSVGSKYTFYIPSPLAYGNAGHGKLVGQNEVLVFDIELLDIKKKGE